MDIAIPPGLIPAVRDVVHRLAIGDYASLERDVLIATAWTGAPATSAADIARTIRDYAATLIELPEDAFRSAETTDSTEEGRAHSTIVDLLTTRTFTPTLPDGTWLISLPLWTAEEGRSGLRLDVEIDATADRPALVKDVRGFPPSSGPCISLSSAIMRRWLMAQRCTTA